MCKYKTWFHHEEKGYVLQCEHCRKVQVNYGILSLNFRPSDFDRFREQIRGHYEETPPTHDPHLKSILLPTPCQGMNLFLSYCELEELHRMLDECDSEMRAAALLDCFHH